MSLREYKRKRHFNRTPEPRGKHAAKAGRSFVIQKHAASHLHYDFRLELDGVLKSWAVPKGPCLDPSVKRLAMHVEDHPVEYGSFEGMIPQGEYGGGTVMLWDRGDWRPVGDPHEGYRSGKLKFTLNGEKLRGAWMLVRTGGRSHGDRDQRQWLLFKERDDDAKPVDEGDVLDESPLSVATGRSLDEIAADRDWVWGAMASSNGKPKRGTARPRKKPRLASHAAKMMGAKAGKFPGQIDVELATLAKEPPDGKDWLHEIKFDGYRIICRINDGKVELISRNHKNWTDRLASVAEAARALPVSQAILDGEVVSVRSDGVTDFQALQNSFRDRRSSSLQYYLFDLLYLDGQDLRCAPLEERKRVLADLLKTDGFPSNLRFSEHIEGNGPDFLKQACEMGLEGIVSKHRDRPYEPGRGHGWLKVKCLKSDEFVIGGYTDPTGCGAGFGALLMGYHNQKGDLRYAGKVGTGFDDRTLRALSRQFQTLRQDESPFSNRTCAMRGVHWVAPKLVAQIAFGAMTHDGIMRHASFQGLREDKPADEVTHDKPVSLKLVTRKGSKPARPTRLTATQTS